MENKHFAESPLIGRKSNGTFYGLKYKNTSKHFTMKIYVVCWQTWLVEIYDSRDGALESSFYLRQVNREEPVVFEMDDSKVYKDGYHYHWINANVSLR